MILPCLSCRSRGIFRTRKVLEYARVIPETSKLKTGICRSLCPCCPVAMAYLELLIHQIVSPNLPPSQGSWGFATNQDVPNHWPGDGRARLLLRIESSQIQSIYVTICCTGMILRYIRVYGGQPAERLSPVKNVKIQSHWAQDCRRISIWRLIDLDATWRTRELGSSSNSHFDGEGQSSTRVICCNWYKHWFPSFAWDTNITLIKLQALLKIQTPWHSLKFRHVSSFQNPDYWILHCPFVRRCWTVTDGKTSKKFS